MKRLLSAAEIAIIVIVALAPVFASFPYRINIFLSWEGAYRLYLGQVPYRDFGMPVGYMYWVVPALFFKVFGPYMITLIKAQAFLNIIAGFAFRSIFKSLQLDPGIRFLSVLVFSLSYTFINYWPWYNHTVIVYELVALAFLMKYFFRAPGRSGYLWLILSSVSLFFSFFTKQDGGGMALLVCIALLWYDCLLQKKWMPLIVFLGSYAATAMVLILPFARYSIGYWFNHGQPPHSSRISLRDILKEFFISSSWLKFYLFLMALLLIATVKNWRSFWRDRRNMIFTLLTIGILVEAAIFQVTSYVPVDNNIFFHSFAFAYIISLLSSTLPVVFTWRPLIVAAIGVLLWWSPVYWKYVERFVMKPGSQNAGTYNYNGYTYGNVVNRNTYMIELDTTNVPLGTWQSPSLKTFRKILMPVQTIDGIERIRNLDVVKDKRDIRVLNMSELTPLAAELPFRLETGPLYPLWYHKGVAMFDRETDTFVNRIRNNFYDLVIYEYIPYLNNFYPYQVRDALLNNYQRVDTFVAPRNPSNHAWIEVYIRK